MYIDFPLILGADYSCGDAEETIQAIRNAIARATDIGLILELQEDKGLVIGMYCDGNRYKDSIIEVRSDGEVNLYGLLEFVYKDMMLFDIFDGKLLINDKPKPLMTFDDFDRHFEIESWVDENDFEVIVETGRLSFKSKDTGETIIVIDAQYSGGTTPPEVDKFVEFIKNLYLELKET